MATVEEFLSFAQKKLQGKKFAVAIQAEPYAHIKTPRGIRMEQGTGGAYVLMDGILKQLGGLMVAVAKGNADHLVVDEKGRFKVNNSRKGYILKRLFLKKKELEGFYYGFANQTFWPLCHGVFVKPIFSPEWWDEYVAVNQKYANAIIEELDTQEAFIWINDYHLALLPKLLKQKRPNYSIGTFWHIPWPTHEIFRICPWRREILEGMLGSDLIGFHRDYHVQNFIECCRRELGVIVESEPRRIRYNNNDTRVNNIPAGIDYEEIKETLAKQRRIDKRIMKKDFGIDYEYLAIGVERSDYTKGLIERVKIIDRFLERYPQYQGKFVYLSICPLSRQKIPAYRNFNRELYDLVDKVNWKYSTYDWQPLVFINRTFPRERLFSYFKLADTCLVTALDDGMNLVAKEYALACNPNKGMLIISKFTGAAIDLKPAIHINPYDIDNSAQALHQALTMSPEEKLRRNKEMREILKEYNIYNWGMNFIRDTIG